jgi:hypothetical protein
MSLAGRRLPLLHTPKNAFESGALDELRGDWFLSQEFSISYEW